MPPTLFDCVLATFAIHWNLLDVTACSAEPVTVIWLVCGEFRFRIPDATENDPMMNAAERMIIPINCSCDRIEPFFRDDGFWPVFSMPMSVPSSVLTGQRYPNSYLIFLVTSPRTAGGVRYVSSLRSDVRKGLEPVGRHGVRFKERTDLYWLDV